MKQRIFLILILSIGLTSKGQINTQKIFNNLPLDKSVKELNEILQNDTLNYKPRKGKDYNYYSLKADSFFNLQPKTSEITAHYFKSMHDSISYPVLIRFVTIKKKKNSSKKVLGTYNKIVDIFKKEYEYSKPEYIKGSMKEKNKETRVDQWTTYFYIKKGDPRYKLSVTWFDEGKYGQQFIISYNLN